MSDYLRIKTQLEERKCQTCQGQGQLESKKCQACQGTGLTKTSLGRRPRPMENKFR